ncbi:MAG: acyltransferase [Bacteroidota bacterium]
MKFEFALLWCKFREYIFVKPHEQTKLYGLDHLRALAITLVFLYHYKIPIFGHPEWLTDIAKFGWTGVDLFFVLSGFLISSQLFSQIKQGVPISFKQFFLKRFFRIIPAFWVVVAIYFCVPQFHERESLSPLWRFLTFTQNFGLDIRQCGTFSHSWSLCVEEHFYFFLPISLICFQRTKLFKNAYWLLIALFLLGFFIRNYCWNNLFLPNIDRDNAWLFWYKYIYYPTYNRLDGLLVGVSIAGIYQFLPTLWSKVSRFGNLLVVLSLIVLTAAYFLCYEEESFYATIFGFPLASIGYGLMVAGAISPNSFLFRLNSKTTTFIATLSYALYLTHKGVIHVTQGLLADKIDVNGNLMLLICIVICVLAALLLNMAIEKPFMKLRDKIIA